MRTIVLDSGPLGRDKTLKAAVIRGLLEACERGEINVVVPSVVVDEVVAGARKKFNEAAKSIRNAQGILSGHGGDYEPLTPLDADALTKSFRGWLLNELDSHGVDVRDVSGASIQGLIDRDLEHRKPFNQQGKGFRDALIWGVVVELEASDDADAITLVTTNTQDFSAADDSSHVHEDLRSDLRDAGSVTIANDLGEVMRQLGELRGELRAEIESKIVEDPMRFAWAVAGARGLPLPTVDAEVVGAQVLGVEVGDAYLEWGVASADVHVTLDYVWTAVVDDWQLEELAGEWPSDIQVDDVMEDAFAMAVSGEHTVDLTVTVGYDVASSGDLDVEQVLLA